MKFIATIGKPGKADQWDEDHEEDTEDPELFMRAQVIAWNATRKDWHPVIELRGVRIVDPRPPSPHKWKKDAGPSPHTYAHAIYHCEVCGVGGYKRSRKGRILLNEEFRATVFERCDTAKEFFETWKPQS